jgi:adenine phosphoribosyltransferase
MRFSNVRKGVWSCEYLRKHLAYSFETQLQDSFEMQMDSIKPGQSVVVIDDLIATGVQFFSSRITPKPMLTFLTGGSAKAAGELIAKQGGKTLEYLFIIELTFLKGVERLDAPVYSIVQSDD